MTVATLVPSREPPHNLEAEQALLAAILVNNRAYEKVSEFLLPEHFSDPVHGRIFEACATLIDRGQSANPVTLKPQFDQDDALTDLGGAAYLVQLAASVVTVTNADDYGHAIREAWTLRELTEIGETVLNNAYAVSLDHPAADQIEDAESRLFSLAETGATSGGFKEFSVVLKEAVRMAGEAFKRDGHVVGVSSGLTDLDRQLGGLHPSDLLILAGRPGMGKTALATNIAFHAATEAKRDDETEKPVVAFFSLEMSAEQLATRILAEATKIPSERIRRGEIGPADVQRLVAASADLEAAPLYIDDEPAITVSTVRTRARRLMRQQGLTLIVVDYLQLMRPGRGNSENRVQEISVITRGLKAIAKELNVPVLALSQLSRAVEQREDKRPLLSDLRESGTIEQDADVVMFVFRESYYLDRAGPVQKPDEDDIKFRDREDKWRDLCALAKGKAEVIVAKHRHGPTSSVTLHFEGSVTRFSDYADPSHLPAHEGEY